MQTVTDVVVRLMFFFKPSIIEKKMSTIGLSKTISEGVYRINQYHMRTLIT